MFTVGVVAFVFVHSVCFVTVHLLTIVLQYMYVQCTRVYTLYDVYKHVCECFVVSFLFSLHALLTCTVHVG